MCSKGSLCHKVLVVSGEPWQTGTGTIQKCAPTAQKLSCGVGYRAVLQTGRDTLLVHEVARSGTMSSCCPCGDQCLENKLALHVTEKSSIIWVAKGPFLTLVGSEVCVVFKKHIQGLCKSPHCFKSHLTYRIWTAPTWKSLLPAAGGRWESYYP